VIVETSRHDGDLATLGAAGLRAVVDSYRQRYRALSGRPGVVATVLFRNHGQRAGASLVHPHSQIIAVTVPPPRLAAVAAWMRGRQAQEGHCVTCALLEAEAAEATRIVAQTPDFVLLVPFAAATPFEMWLLPRRHQACFGALAESELDDFALLLQSALRRLKAALGDPPYNFVVESWGDAARDFAHWRLRIVPELTTPGGFERGAGLAINPSRPEADAEALRSVPLLLDEAADRA
jgi:UDPglucose--hexose-1-phosphate uridylyltransferase